ncbi:FCD domain-containing protein [Actinopolymorpha sp. B9G3]|uniref:FadR/GntR family transcriptional regulator n=1 Tax=Actinopolymorpha sp. B9G3 TaxID=3158970 RepID=UPI0032D8B6A3
MNASATETAIAKIRELIMSGELDPGARLPAEGVLAQWLGLARNSTREAVRALVAARVLDVRRGDGTYVTSLRPELLLEGIGFAAELMRGDAVLELVEVRRLLEPRAVAIAAMRATTSQLHAIGDCLRQMRAAADHAEFVRLDADFHDLVNRVSGNEALASVLRGVSNPAFRARVWRDILEADASERTMAEHERIYAALVARNSVEAEQAAEDHIRSSEAWLLRVAQSGLPPTC